MKRNLKFAGRAALTGAAAASLAFTSPEAAALGLGRLTVQSALGESLRAEIEVTSMTPEEAANLRIRVAPPESYRAANVEYNPVLPSTRAVLERRPDGRQFVRLTSDRGVQEPFVDVILEISWATGRLVRDYTLLFDPPVTARAPASAAVPMASTPSTPSSNAASSVNAQPPATVSTPPALAASGRTEATPSRAERRAAARQAAAAMPPAPTAQAAAAPVAGEQQGDEYRVRAGDTLSRIAARTQRPGISLDQMLVALYRANPQAFMNSNMNRLKSGVVLAVPSATTAQAVASVEARQVVIAQSADFGAYRQRLAGGTLPVRPEGNRRGDSGSLQASVEDRKAGAAPSKDALRIDKGAAASMAQDARISADRERQAATARAAEIKRNVSELQTLAGAASAAAQADSRTAPAASPAATPSTAKPPASPSTATAAAPVAPAVVAAARPSTTVSVPTPSAMTPPPVVVAQAPAAPAVVAAPPIATPPAPAAAPADTVPTSKPAAIATAPMPPAVAVATEPPPVAPVASSTSPVPGSTSNAAAPAAVPAPAAASRPATVPNVSKEPSFLGSLLEDNPLALGLGALAAALLAGFGIYRVSKRGRKESGETSFLESRLQPDSFFGASGGQRIDTRDAAASSSSMTYSLSQLDAIGDVDPVAEADVYLAYGRDLQAEEILKEAMRSSPERLAIRTKLLEVYAKRRDTKGFELLATQLFALTRGEGEDWAKAQQLGAEIDPDNALFQPGGAPMAGPSGEVIEPLGASTLPHSVVPVPTNFGHSLPASQGANSAFGELDLDLDNPGSGQPTAPGVLDSTEPFAIEPSLGDDPFMQSTHKMPLAAAEPTADKRDEPLPFDMSGFSIDMNPAPAPATAAAASLAGAELASGDFDRLPVIDDEEDGDPMLRKLELAEEFRQIGDKDGARDLLREVLAKASGATHSRAQGMLEDLG